MDVLSAALRSADDRNSAFGALARYKERALPVLTAALADSDVTGRRGLPYPMTNAKLIKLRSAIV